ncbi:hypothetical protein NS206_06055 [Microbacterium testaceum]|uniref:DUF6518 family protein n=1 Tax=Microbacterium testaceum TaxID=2033 RepID=UPI000734609A|nr:DUF6518 family protein [Microbacterium testaceum]KTS64945.1 hypothetical protein NS206_06055 [Microbacterium testaceum]
MHPRHWLVPAVSVAAASLALGGLTSVGQSILPEALVSFANSAGGWTILAFGLVWLTRARPPLAAALGVMSFVLLVEGYRIVSGWRGYYYAEPFQDTFTIIGLFAGPVVGLSASLLRWGPGSWKPFAAAPVAAVLIGEGVYGLTVVGATTSPVYWVAQLVLGVALVLSTVAAARPRITPGILGSLVTLGGATAFVAFYSWVGQVGSTV